MEKERLKGKISSRMVCEKVMEELQAARRLSAKFFQDKIIISVLSLDTSVGTSNYSGFSCYVLPLLS